MPGKNTSSSHHQPLTSTNNQAKLKLIKKTTPHIKLDDVKG
jgi:hypothetical protein